MIGLAISCLPRNTWHRIPYLQFTNAPCQTHQESNLANLSTSFNDAHHARHFSEAHQAQHFVKHDKHGSTGTPGTRACKARQTR